LSEGKLEYKDEQDSKPVEPEKFYQYISIAAPYLELIEEMTAKGVPAFSPAIQIIAFIYYRGRNFD
jgi:hypothetical protein